LRELRGGGSAPPERGPERIDPHAIDDLRSDADDCFLQRISDAASSPASEVTMSQKPRPPRSSRVAAALASLAALAAAVVPANAALADPIVPTPVGPNQYYVGVVNGNVDRAVIRMECPGPIPSPSRLGRPLPGQTVAVRQVPGIISNAGFTGSAARAIAGLFSPSASSDPTVVFTVYGVAQEIPRTMLLPCAGSGSVIFFARPGSNTARSATVRVTFVS
jgi:hypothetical protein